MPSKRYDTVAYSSLQIFTTPSGEGARGGCIEIELGCRSFRATGITVYLKNGGLLEHAQQMAAHDSARTTKPNDRRSDKAR